MRAAIENVLANLEGDIDALTGEQARFKLKMTRDVLRFVARQGDEASQQVIERDRELRSEVERIRLLDEKARQLRARLRR